MSAPHVARRHRPDLTRKTEDLADLQAMAAIGQGILMETYSRLLGERGIQVGQVLLTAHDFGDRSAYLNARATLQRLTAWGVLPVINENDTTATDEITLGDNDRLSALVAALTRARMLILLTDTAGLHSEDPRLNREAPLIEEVEQIDSELEAAAGGPGLHGRGGMATKVAAAKIASWSGVPCVIAYAFEPNVLARAVDGDSPGTRIRPRSKPMPSRKVWIAFARLSAGRIVVDEGAARAVTSRGGSLLSVGIVGSRGFFDSGSVVDVVDRRGQLIARGITRTGTADLPSAPGTAATERSGTVVIHRDDMVVVTESHDG